jgi:phosphatidylserine/phosphatidylglycerophosphate/cardiolipin synthase-like enzyme
MAALRHITAVILRPALLAAALFIFTSSAVLSAGADIQAGTRLLPNRDYGEALLQAVRNSRRDIRCSYFLFKISGARGNMPRRIAEELVRARRRGVDVTVVLERDNGRAGGVTADNRETAAFLTAAGVRVYFDSPSVVTHAKCAVIDGRYVFLGSHNLTQAALRHNNELSVVIDSPEMAAEVASYMDRL